jgi:hypothetical protein
VERRVEDGDVRDIGERRPRPLESVERRSVVERSKIRELAERRRDRLVDDDGLTKALAAVDDAVADGGDVSRKLLDRRDVLALVVAIDDRQLEARGARVDDENPQCGQVQSRMLGSSSPCSRVQARARTRASTIS